MSLPHMISPGLLRRPVPKKTLRAVNFICNVTNANAVSLVGDFNGWNAWTHPMRRMPDGAWHLQLELHHGHHRYAFLVDSVIQLDPTAQGVTRNERGERVSLIPVS